MHTLPLYLAEINLGSSGTPGGMEGRRVRIKGERGKGKTRGRNVGVHVKYLFDVPAGTYAHAGAHVCCINGDKAVQSRSLQKGEGEHACTKSDGWLKESEIETSTKVRIGPYHQMHSGGATRV